MHTIPHPSPENLAKWGNNKMVFHDHTGVSNVAYSGGRGKNVEDMRAVNTVAQVLSLKKMLGAMSPHQVCINNLHLLCEIWTTRNPGASHPLLLLLPPLLLLHFFRRQSFQAAAITPPHSR